MGQMVEPIAAHFRFTDFVMGKVLGDLTDEQARTRTRNGEGPSVAWIVGHILCFRHRLLGQFGDAREHPFARQCGTDGATDGSDYPSLAEIKAEWQDTQRQLDQALAGVRTEQLEAKTDSQGAVHGERTVLDEVTFVMWHESYHMGALGAVRTSLGLKPTSQLVMGA